VTPCVGAFLVGALAGVAGFGLVAEQLGRYRLRDAYRRGWVNGVRWAREGEP